MPGSTTSVFSEPDDYQAALQLEGGFELVITRPGAFRAELTRIELPRMRLMAGCERLARIGFLTQAPDLIRIVLPMRHGELLFSGGIVSRPDELVTYAPGQSIHERTDGPCHWRSIWLPVEDLLRYGHAVIGRSFEIPDGLLRWRPKREALNRLSHLHNHAIHTSKVGPRVFAAAQATRGLEQELIANLIDCMQGTAPNLDAAANVRRTDVMNRFEGLLVKSAEAPTIHSADMCGVGDTGPHPAGVLLKPPWPGPASVPALAPDAANPAGAACRRSQHDTHRRPCASLWFQRPGAICGKLSRAIWRAAFRHQKTARSALIRRCVPSDAHHGRD